ncbi:MAG: CDP-glucose 4,6-dehydratase [Eubacteriales bacterium]|nr:CDP-glucose 4,6-dehydratase [Eubacteriales bacterium]
MLDLSFYRDKRVLVTGHTGFKGTWLTKILVGAGAEVIGYSLFPSTEPNLYTLSEVDDKINSVIGDIRDFDKLYSVFKEYRPEIVFHLAAQPLVRDSYKHPRYTYQTNVMGTVNILECMRIFDCVKSFLNVTTDKVYQNDDIPNHPFSEDEPLDGYDPYSNSKSCSELVTHSYKKSFFADGRCAISTARAGNVIGGGDFSADRIIPDCVRALIAKKDIVVRNPNSIRPYQHVLEPLYVYLEIAQKQYNDIGYSGYYNVGPDDCDCVTTGELTDKFCRACGNIKWINKCDGGPHEAAFLKLDNSKIKRVFDWKPRWHIDEVIDKTVEWTCEYLSDEKSVPEVMDRQINEFFGKI